jgi:hypothetical protein
MKAVLEALKALGVKTQLIKVQKIDELHCRAFVDDSYFGTWGVPRKTFVD